MDQEEDEEQEFTKLTLPQKENLQDKSKFTLPVELNNITKIFLISDKNYTINEAVENYDVRSVYRDKRPNSLVLETVKTIFDSSYIL